jgi:hypothetical protein
VILKYLKYFLVDGHLTSRAIISWTFFSTKFLIERAQSKTIETFKSTYLAYKISYRKISEINVEAKSCGFHFYGKFCSEKTLTTSVLRKNFDHKKGFCWE